MNTKIAQAKHQEAKKGFDLNVHVRNGKGEIVEENHYILRINGDVREFERPPGSGIIYDEAGTLLRREKREASFVQSNKKEFSNAALMQQLQDLKNENAKLKLQLEEPEFDELDEVHVTVDDVLMNDVAEVAMADADNSDELRLMAQAGVSMKGAAVLNPKNSVKG